MLRMAQLLEAISEAAMLSIGNQSEALRIK
jgi:hypothetical protein